MLYRFLQFWIRLVLIVVFKIRVFGGRNVPVSGPVIFASNHQSFMDPVLVGAVLDRPLSFMARKTLFERSALFAWLIRTVNAFPVNLNGTDLAAVRETMRRLHKSEGVVVFPEGTRTYTGEIGGLKPGLFMIAVRSGTPVVPVVVDGAFESWPRSKRAPRPYPISVAFGQPLTGDPYDGKPQLMASACRKALLELQRAMRRRRELREGSFGEVK